MTFWPPRLKVLAQQFGVALVYQTCERVLGLPPQMVDQYSEIQEVSRALHRPRGS